MDSNNEALSALLSGIEYLIEQKIRNAPFARLKNGLIIGSNNDGTYNVEIDNKIYSIRSINNSTLANGDVVQVIIAQNDYSNMFILN
ncbi:MAG: hypothetical protein J6T10_25025 [Methanobrevibacter sp.]|nr:hypothetical protein [Methanobrevibacter sp.]